MERTKKIFEKEWKESERLHANYERLDNDNNATKADVEKVTRRINVHLIVGLSVCMCVIYMFILI